MPLANPQSLSAASENTWVAEGSERRSPHTGGAGGRAPQTTTDGAPAPPPDESGVRAPHTEAVDPTPLSRPANGYVDSHSVQQQQQQPLHDMGSSSVPPPAYAIYAPEDGTSHQMSHPDYPYPAGSYYQQPYTQPPPRHPQPYSQPYPVPPSQQPEMQQLPNAAVSLATFVSPSPQSPNQYQAVNYSPGITGSSPNTPYKSSETIHAVTTHFPASSGHKRRKVFWGCCIFIVAIAVVLGVVLGVVVPQINRNSRDISPSSATSTPSSSASSSATATITSATLTSMSQPSSSPTTTTTSQNPFSCIDNCNSNFNKCNDACTAAYNSCNTGCGSDISCQVQCGSTRSTCVSPCYSASASCTC
ncbi:hypothetical protein EDD21DRAFT_165326 [Dissophora ornata]|nr:hypothetical protein EDD21DRAFT_165326 [Dissophora ornata]